MSQILEYLLPKQQAMVQTLEQLVMCESPTHDREGVNAVGETLAGFLGTLGADVERLRQAHHGDHRRISWGEGERQILMLGHMDTVWDRGEAGRRPFRVGQDPSTGAPIATGPGVMDMKGGLVIGLYALTALSELGLKPGHRLVWLLNSDEEVGSPTSRPIIEEEARRSACALVLEPSYEEALITWRKGVGRFDLQVEGLASHSGGAHERGVSAVEELAHQVLRLEAMTDYGRGTTVNVGVVQGGTKANVRPAAARAQIDLRVTSTEEGERMTAALHGLQAANPKARLVVSGGITRPPWSPSPAGEALFERVRAVGARLGLELWPGGAGGGSDGNFSAALGVPTLDGLGVVGDDAHAASEWADLSSLPRRAALLAEIVMEMDR